MRRKRQGWKAGQKEIQLGERTLIVGVLHVAPDSPVTGGRYADPELAVGRAIDLQTQGAHILEIAAESMSSDRPRVIEGEELRRLVPVLKQLKGKLDIPIAVRTYKSAVAAKAIEHGATILHDPTGLTMDVQLARVAADGDAGLVLSHTRGTPEMWAKQAPLIDLMGTILRELDATLSRAQRNGVRRDSIVVDPGLGFGKQREQNAGIVMQLARMADLGFPVHISPSRKQFLTKQLESDSPWTAAAAVTAAILNGAHLVRVHEVRDMAVVAQIADALSAETLEIAAERPKMRGPRPVKPVFEDPQPRTRLLPPVKRPQR